jgi:putative peptidoglycan lipid II flippase
MRRGSLTQMLSLVLAYGTSRVLGMLRDVIIAWKFGAQQSTDVYNAAFLIPDILNYFVAATAFSVVLVPMLSHHVTASDPPELTEDGSRLFSEVLTPMTILITGLSALAWILTPQINALLYPQFVHQAAKFDLLVHLTRVIIPNQVFFVIGGLLIASQRVRGDFRSSRWQPNLYNAGIILGGLLLGNSLGIAGFSYGSLAGAFAGALLVPLALGWGRVRFRPMLSFRSPGFLHFVRKQLPLMIGFSLLTVDEWFLRIFGAKSGIPDGTITCLRYARALALVPVGLAGQAAGQVSLTELSRLWSRQEVPEYGREFQKTLRGLIFISGLLAGALVAAALPLTSLIYFHGHFSAENNQSVAHLLRLMALFIPAFATLQVLVNGYYSKENTLRPMFVGTVCVVVALLVYALMSARYHGAGIAMASAIGLWAQFLITLADYHLRYGRREGFRPHLVLLGGAKGLAVGLAAAGLVILARQNLPIFPADETRIPGAIVSLLLRGGIFGGAAVALSLLSGGEEKRLVVGAWGKVLRKLGMGSGAS